MEAELLSHLQVLAQRYVDATGHTMATVAQKALNDWRFFQRLEESERASFTARKYDIAVGWFAENWPAAAAWPDDVPRPTTPQGAAA